MFGYKTLIMKKCLCLLTAMSLLLMACGGGKSNSSGSQKLTSLPQSSNNTSSLNDTSSLNNASISKSSILNEINQARSQARSCGAKGNFAAAAPLKWNDALEYASTKHSQDMARHNYFEHISLDGRSPKQRAMDAGYQGYLAGFENISAGRATAKDAIAGWLESDGHCANIMNPKVTEVGMGYGYNDNSQWKHYWTQNFAIGKM